MQNCVQIGAAPIHDETIVVKYEHSDRSTSRGGEEYAILTNWQIDL